MKLTFIATSVITFSTLANCEKQEGEIGKVIKQDGLKLEITAINDSRCPVGVNCVTEGEAVVSFEAKTSGQSAEFGLVLNTAGDEKDTVILGYQVTLLEVNPYPEENTTGHSANQTVKVEIIKQ